MLDEVLTVLEPKPGMTIVDCTVGWAGHGAELLTRIGASGLLIGLDMDSENVPKARERLDAIGHPFHLHHANFAGLQQVLAEHGISRVDALLADLGMSSMQVDDPERGFSYVRNGVLDMRMDRTRGRTASQILAHISKDDLVQELREIGDEPAAETIALAIIKARSKAPITLTKELANIIQAATDRQDWRLHPRTGTWNLHPAARTFQTLRILVNRELSNLDNLLRIVPAILRPGGTAAIVAFHSGEDRRVKSAFRSGLASAAFATVSSQPIRATLTERTENPRSRSAKLRWAKRNAI
jgi:16S rRNA (cytosine1402-N4)-methyltransferase